MCFMTTGGYQEFNCIMMHTGFGTHINKEQEGGWAGQVC